MIQYSRPRRLFVVREPNHASAPGEVPTVSGPEEDTQGLDVLADEIATLAAQIHAATQRLLEMIAEFDRRRGWEASGHRSCAHWLAYRTGIELGAAREKVRAARALTTLPATRKAMARGELSFSKVRALTRVATPENEEALVELARGTTTAGLERAVRAWKRGDADDEVERERAQWEDRRFSVRPDLDGMYVVRGRLPAEVGALLMRAIEAASDQLFRDECADTAPTGAAPDEENRRQAARRRADALALLAERAMSAGFAEDSPISGTRAERYQVVLHVSTETLEEGGDPVPDRSHLDDGTRVSAETSRRLSCDAGIVRMTHGPPHGQTPSADLPVNRSPDRSADFSADLSGNPSPSGPILDVGRRTRSIPPALRRALEARDRGCRFPGCGSRFTDAHHVKHWADGGETSLGNCLLLCRHHHRLMHEGGWRIVWWGQGRPAFIDPRGGTHYEGRWQPPAMAGDGEEAPRAQGAPQPTPVGDPVDELRRRNREAGADPDGYTASARWKREVDVPTEVYLRAWEGVA